MFKTEDLGTAHLDTDIKIQESLLWFIIHVQPTVATETSTCSERDLISSTTLMRDFCPPE